MLNVMAKQSARGRVPERSIMRVLPSFVISDAPGMIGGRRMSSRLWALLVFAFSKHSMVLSDGYDCGYGTYYTTDVTNCSACQPGTYQDVLTQTACKNCPAGTFSQFYQGASSCSDCAAGTYLETEGNDAATDCVPCAAGTYSATAGASSASACLACDVGKFSAARGAATVDTCADCPAGKYSAAGDSLCTDCAAGKFSAAQGAATVDTCADCPAGEYSATAGASSSSTCTSCAPGKYGSLTPEIASGLRGLIGRIATSTLQTWTVAGISAWKMGAQKESCETACASSMLSCREFKASIPETNVLFNDFSRMPAITSEENFHVAPICWDANGDGGSRWVCYANKGDSKCNVPTPEAHSRLCACGSSSPIVAYQGASSCSDCAAGTYLETEGNDAATDCVPCAAATYSATAGASSASACLACAAGTYSKSAGMSACTNCAAGKYTAQTLILPPGLQGLSDTIATSTLNNWGLAGIGAWKMGTLNQNCDAVCNDISMQCFVLSSGQQPSNDVVVSLANKLGDRQYYGYRWQLFASPIAPFCWASPGFSMPQCYSGSVDSDCGQASPTYIRICACRSLSPPTFQGASTCTNCAAGKFSAAVGAATVNTCAVCSKDQEMGRAAGLG